MSSLADEHEVDPEELVDLVDPEELVVGEGPDIPEQPSLGYLQFQIPDMPFSAVRVGWGTDYSWYMLEAAKFRKAYEDVFAPAEPESAGPLGDALMQAADRTAPGPLLEAARQMAQPAQGNSGTGVFCSQHRVECLKTAPHYDKDGDRYYHPLPESEHRVNERGTLVKNHNLYLRQTVDANGTSNDPRERSGGPPRQEQLPPEPSQAIPSDEQPSSVPF